MLNKFFRFIFLFLIFGACFLFTKSASAATYYVSPTGNNTNTGLGSSDALAWLTIAKAETIAVAGDTVKILPGTYNETILFGTRSGTAGNPITFEANDSSNKPIISGAGKAASTVQVWTDWMVFRNLVIKDADAVADANLFIRGGANDVVFEGCEITNSGSNNVTITSQWNNITFNRCKITDPYSSGIYLSGNASDAQLLTINYSIVGGHKTVYNRSATGPIQHVGSPGVITVNINNSLIYGGNINAIYAQYNNSTWNIKNSTIEGSPAGVFPYQPVFSIEGTLNVDHSIITGSPYDYDNYYGGVGTQNEGVGILKNILPLHTTARNPLSWFHLRSDDLTFDYWEQVAAIYEAAGVRGTFYGQPAWLETVPNYAARMAALINAGHDIGSHSYSHSSPTSGVTWGLQVQYTGGGDSCTMSYNVAAHTFSTNCSTPAHNISYDTSSDSYNSLSEVWNALRNTGYYTVSINGAVPKSEMLMSAHADVAGQDIKTAAYQMPIDLSRWFYDETERSKQWLENTIQGAGVTGWTCKVWAYPNDAVTVGYPAAVQSAGYLGSANGAGSAQSDNLSEVFPFQTWQQNFPAGSSNTETCRANTRAIIAAMQQGKKLGSYNSHNAADMTVDCVTAVVNELQNYGVTIRLLKDILTDVTTSGDWTDADADGTRWTRTLTDNSNYNLQASSTAIDAGTDVSLTTDYAGNKIYGTPDIGGYEYQPPHTVGTNEIDIGAGARIYGDGKFRDVGTTTSVTADLAVTPSGGTFTETTSPIPAFLDVTVTTWTTTHKNWTESNAEALLTTTDHTIGDLNPNKYYTVTVTNADALTNITGISGTTCSTVGTDRVCLSDSSGKIYFRYDGGYSTHTFDLIEDTTSPTNIGLTSITPNSSSQLTILAQTAVDAGAGLHTTPYYFAETSGNSGGSDSIYQTSATYVDTGLSPNTQYTYKVKAKDLNSNESAYSTTLSKYTLAPTPTNLTITHTPTNTTLTVDTFTNDTSGLSGYYFSRPEVNSGWITTNTWTDSNADSGVFCGSHTYSIKYRNSEGVETDPISSILTMTPCGGGQNFPVTATTPVIVPVVTTPTPVPSAPTNPSIPSEPATYNFGSKTLKSGSRGEPVKELQRFLNQNLKTDLIIDGKLGPKTVKVIKQYQKANGLKPDGLVGKETKKKMRKMIQ